MRAVWTLLGVIALALVLGLHSCGGDSDDDDANGGSEEAELTIEIDGDTSVDEITAHVFTLKLAGDGADDVNIGISEFCPLLLVHRDGDTIAKIAQGKDISGNGRFRSYSSQSLQGTWLQAGHRREADPDRVV